MNGQQYHQRAINFALSLLTVWFASAPLSGFCADTPDANAYAPANLPGNGLAQHDFLCSGEAHEERLSLVRGGRVVWSYTHPGRGEISDTVLEPSGHILFAHQFGITEITRDKKVVWNYDAPAHTEIHTAQPLGTNRVFFIENGNPARFIVMNKDTGAIEHQFVLLAKDTNSVHRQFRRARLTPAGTILVAHLDLGKIVEYDWDGRALWSQDLTNCWSAEWLPNGHVLAATSAVQVVREIDRQGRTVWEWTPADAPGYQFGFTQTAIRLPNGNTLINNWFEHPPQEPEAGREPVQAIEVTPDKKIVWALRSWAPPADLGPATTFQMLDP
jgi:hypothetical protein